MVAIVESRTQDILIALVEKYHKFGFEKPELVLGDSEDIKEAF